MLKLTTQRQNSNQKRRYSQHYPRLITGNYIPDDPVNVNGYIAMSGLRIPQNYPPHHTPDDRDTKYLCGVATIDVSDGPITVGIIPDDSPKYIHAFEDVFILDRDNPRIVIDLGTSK